MIGVWVQVKVRLSNASSQRIQALLFGNTFGFILPFVEKNRLMRLNGWVTLRVFSEWGEYLHLTSKWSVYISTCPRGVSPVNILNPAGSTICLHIDFSKGVNLCLVVRVSSSRSICWCTWLLCFSCIKLNTKSILVISELNTYWNRNRSTSLRTKIPYWY